MQCSVNFEDGQPRETHSATLFQINLEETSYKPSSRFELKPISPAPRGLPVTHIMKPIGPCEFHGQWWDHIHQVDQRNASLDQSTKPWIIKVQYPFSRKQLTVMDYVFRGRYSIDDIFCRGRINYCVFPLHQTLHQRSTQWIGWIPTTAPHWCYRHQHSWPPIGSYLRGQGSKRPQLRILE